MTAGDCCILREVAGGESDNSGTLDNYTWDTEVHRDAASFELFSDLGVRCLNAGPKLVAYNTSHTAAGSNRSELRSFIQVNAVPTTYGGTSDYSRRSADGFVTSSAAMAILDVSASDILSIGHLRADTNTTSGTLTRAAGEMGFAVVELDDAWSYLRVQDNTSQAVAASAGVTPPFLIRDLNWTDLSLRVQDRADAGFTHSTTVSPAEVTLAGNRQYLVCYSVEFQNTSGSARRNGVVRCQVGTNIPPGSVSTAYARGSNATQLPIATTAFILDSTEADQVLKLQAAVDCEASGQTLNVLNVALSVLDLSDVGEFIGVRPTADFTADTAPGTFDPVEFGEVLVSKGTNYSWSGASPTRIATSQAGRHLLWSSFHTQRSSVNGTRKRPQMGFRYNDGSADVGLGYGIGNEFNRGDQSTTSSWVAAGIAGGVFDLATPQFVEVTANDAATTTNAGLDWESAYTSAFAIELASLAPGAPTIEAPLESASVELLPVDLTAVRGMRVASSLVEFVAIDLTVRVAIVVALEPAVFELTAVGAQLNLVVALESAAFVTTALPYQVNVQPSMLPVQLEVALFSFYSRLDPQLNVRRPLEVAQVELTAIDPTVRVAIVVALDVAVFEVGAVAVALGVSVRLEPAVVESAATDLAGVVLAGQVLVQLDPAVFELAAPEIEPRVPRLLEPAVFELGAEQVTVGRVFELETALIELAPVGVVADVPTVVNLEPAVFELAAVDVVRQVEGVVQVEMPVRVTAELELAVEARDAVALPARATVEAAWASVPSSSALALPVRAVPSVTLPLRVD